MEEKTIKVYDETIHLVLNHLYHLGKENGNKLEFGGFNKKDKGHLALIRLFRFCATLFGIEVKVKMNPIKFIFFRKKFDPVKEIKRGKSKGCFDFSGFIKEIESATDRKGIFADIYEDYYEDKE